MANDYELLSTPSSWSSMADLQLMLILYLYFDHEERHLQDLKDDDFVANRLLLPPNPSLNDISGQTENDASRSFVRLST